MVNKSFTIKYDEYNSPEELTPDQRELLDKAIDAAGNAYAPYSKFRVGAAVRLENGIVVTGNNQENAAYPSGLCAERVALFHAGSNHPREKVLSIAIAAKTSDGIPDDPVSPCGGCRQVLHEAEKIHNHPVEIILFGKKKIQVIRQAADLLPLPFVLKFNH